MERKEDELVDGSTLRGPILPSFGYPEKELSTPEVDEQGKGQGQGQGPPHEALFLVLAYLPLLELLSMSAVCRSLRDAVDKDVLVWLHIIVEKPLNIMFSDELMLKLTSRANGRLRTLALIGCTKITDLGLLQVIEKNPHINKV